MELLIREPAPNFSAALKLNDGTFESKDDTLMGFYEALKVRLAIGSRDRHDCVRSGGHEGSMSRSNWDQFLDNLSWLCDRRPGGESVTAIAAEDCTQHITYWLAANHGVKLEVMSHLQQVMCQLRIASCSSGDKQKALEDQIVFKSIQFSKMKIHNYWRQLKFYIKKCAEKPDKLLTEPESYILHVLEVFEPMKDNYLGLCDVAYNFRKTPAMRLLTLKSQNNNNDTWFYIWHYIGRLGSWRHAAKILIRGSVEFPRWVKTAVIKEIPHMNATTIKIRKFSSIQDGLESIMPQFDMGLLNAAMPMDHKTQIMEEKKLVREALNLTRFQTTVHAELVIAEYFFRNSLSFVDGIRYVGCSKRSCYCCNMYMQLHPGQFKTRPCHGKVWMKWGLPVLFFDNLNAEDGHVQDILAKMVQTIQEDIIKQFSSKHKPLRQGPDSSANLTYDSIASLR